MIIQYDEDNFEEASKNVDKVGIPPAAQDNIGLAYQHIFWGLKYPSEFIEKNPGYKGKKLMAILASDAEFKCNGGRDMHCYQKDSGLPQFLIQFLEGDDNFETKGLEKFDLSGC